MKFWCSYGFIPSSKQYAKISQIPEFLWLQFLHLYNNDIGLGQGSEMQIPTHTVQVTWTLKVYITAYHSITTCYFFTLTKATIEISVSFTDH